MVQAVLVHFLMRSKNKKRCIGTFLYPLPSRKILLEITWYKFPRKNHRIKLNNKLHMINIIDVMLGCPIIEFIPTINVT